MQRALWDPVDPTELRSLDPALRARVNGEIYRFSRPGTLRRFTVAPALYCGLLRDPVTGQRFWPSTRSPRLQWKDGPYFFASDSTRSVFAGTPARYEVRRQL